jgi:hypothetical protein
VSQVYKFNENVTPTPTSEPRKGQGKMSDEDVQSIMHGLISDAVQMVDGELTPQREKATDYFHARPFGNEEDGRSQVIITEVRDSVLAVTPGLLRVFFGPERVVEMVPRTERGVATAQQATDYIQYVFAEDNKGFLKTHSVLVDGLVRKIGVFKWWWESESHQAYKEEGISRDELVALASRDDVDLDSVSEVDPTPDSEAAELNKEAQDQFKAAQQQYQAAVQQAKQAASQPPQPGQPPAPPAQIPPPPQQPPMEKAYDVSYTVRVEGKPCIETVPPEEFLFNRTARDVESALMVAHRMQKTKGELLAYGIPQAVLDEYGTIDNSLGTNQEAVARNADINIAQGNDPTAGETNDKVLYVEAYPFLDLNGDGNRELCKVCLVGPSYHVALPPEPVDERPFAVFCPIPEPHTMLGQSDADLTMDLQLTKSSIVRSMLDSLALSIYPRTTALEGLVNIDDLLNTEIGAIIRIRKENAVQQLTHPFTGQNALPVLEYFDTVTENRTRRSKGAMGLDADALQSSTSQAVGAAVQSSQEGTELIARIFAEQALKPLFRGIYRLLVKYRPAKRLVRLRGSYAQIDTQQWEADMDVIVNVALGTSNTEKKILALAGLAEKMEQQIAQFGPVGPLCGLPQLREVYARISELSGIKDTSALWKPMDPNWQPPAPPPPQPTPEQVLAQGQMEVEKLRTEKDLRIKQAELKLKQQQQAFDQELAIKKLANDFVLRRYQIDAQFKTNHSQMMLEHDARSEEAELSGVLDIHDQLHSHAMDRHSASLDAAAANADQQEASEPTE